MPATTVKGGTPGVSVEPLEWSDLVGQALNHLTRAMTDRPRDAEKWIEAAAEVRDVIAGERPSPLEQLTAELVALAHLDFLRCSMQRDAQEPVGRHHASSTWLTYLDRRATQAHRRLMAALKTMAAIKRIPAITLANIQVVNVGGPPR